MRSGVMTDTEERGALQEIEDAMRIREVVEGIKADSDAIDAAVTKLKQPYDPEVEAISERYYTLEAEMAVMKRKVVLFGNPSLLFEQQRKLQRQINTLFFERYVSISQLCKDNAEFYAMFNEEWSTEREAKVGEKRKAGASLF